MWSIEKMGMVMFEERAEQWVPAGCRVKEWSRSGRRRAPTPATVGPGRASASGLGLFSLPCFSLEVRVGGSVGVGFDASSSPPAPKMSCNWTWKPPCVVMEAPMAMEVACVVSSHSTWTSN